MDSDAIGQVTARARARAASGDLAGAAELLGPALSAQDGDPDTAPAPVAEAAAVYARVLTGLQETTAARGWASYAHAASRRLHGPNDERTLGTAATLATVLHRAGALHRAARLYEELIGRLAEVDGDRSARALAARADLATVLHARGDCRAARRLLTQTRDEHRTRYGEAEPAGIKMLARLGSMERACGDLADGDRRLAEALRLCHAHLGDAHPLTAQVAALVRAPADTGHLCTTPELPATAPPEHAGPEDAEDELPEGGAFVGTPPFSTMPASSRASRGGAGAPGDPADRPGETGPRPDGDDLDEPWWPQDAYAPVHPPAPEPDPMVWTAEAPQQITDAAPPPRFGRLPSGHANPVVVGLAAVIAGTLAAAAVGWAMTTGNDRATTDRPTRASSAVPAAPTAAPPTTPVPAPAPAPTGPPTGVRLSEGRDSVTVTWRYPAGAEGPVVIAGGRTGQPMQAFATLPAGSTRYVVYGLSSSLNYCFRVAVAYSTDVVARAEPICTNRRR